MLEIILIIVGLYFFFLVLSGEQTNSKLFVVERIQIPHFVRALICYIPILNVTSSEYQIGDNPLAIYLTIGLLSSPFALVSKFYQMI